MKIIYSLGLVALLLSFARCADPWDAHLSAGESDVNQHLLQRLEGEANASVFLSLLRASGVNATLDGRNSYTVFAPNNESLQPLVSELQADREALVNFVQNHIAVSTHRLNTSADTVQLTMLNGKILDLVSSRIADVSFVKTDQGSADGLYHVLSGPLMPQQNLWEFINSHTDYAQNAYIVGLNTYNLYETDVTEDPKDELLNNEFLQQLGDVRVEKDRYTYFVLANDVFDEEVAQFLPYVRYRDHADSSLQVTKYHVVKDLIFDQAYNRDNLPSQLVSITGVTFPIDQRAIVETIPLSNGYVHVLDASTLPLANRLLDLVVEGEDYSWTYPSAPNNTFVRQRQDLLGHLFRDVLVQNHGSSNMNLALHLPHLLSTNYDVYWRAVNDVQSNVFQQRVVMAEVYTELDQNDDRVYPIIHAFPYTNVELRNYDEVYLGEFVMAEFKQVIAFLNGAAVTTNGNNTITADYLRFVPKLKEN